MVHVAGIHWAGYSKSSVRSAAMFIYYNHTPVYKYLLLQVAIV